MAQQLAVLSAEVFHFKTVLSNGVAYLNTMVILVLICLFHMCEAAMPQQSPPSIWETMIHHLADFALTIEEPNAIWCY
jgi:hypothetical protein